MDIIVVVSAVMLLAWVSLGILVIIHKLAAGNTLSCYSIDDFYLGLFLLAIVIIICGRIFNLW